MKKKKYEYLVAYNFNKEGYLSHCSGTMTIRLNKKIKSGADLQEINDFIVKEIEGAQNLTIYNFILLRKFRE